MKRILIVTDDLVKVELLTGIIGKIYSRLSILWINLSLRFVCCVIKKFSQVELLTADCIRVSKVKTYYYSQELAKIDYSKNRLEYWRRIEEIIARLNLDKDVSLTFKTRLCIYLTYNFFVYEEVEAVVAARIKPDKITHFFLKPF